MTARRPIRCQQRGITRGLVLTPAVLDRDGCCAIVSLSVTGCLRPWTSGYMTWLAHFARQPGHIPLFPLGRGRGCPEKVLWGSYRSLVLHGWLSPLPIRGFLRSWSGRSAPAPGPVSHTCVVGGRMAAASRMPRGCVFVCRRLVRPRAPGHVG